MRVTTIRFNLKFFNANGEEDVVRTLDDLRSKFNLSDLCEYLKAGDLTRWLRGLNETRIAAEIESLRKITDRRVSLNKLNSVLGLGLDKAAIAEYCDMLTRQKKMGQLHLQSGDSQINQEEDCPPFDKSHFKSSMCEYDDVIASGDINDMGEVRIFLKKLMEQHDEQSVKIFLNKVVEERISRSWHYDMDRPPIVMLAILGNKLWRELIVQSYDVKASISVFRGDVGRLTISAASKRFGDVEFLWLGPGFPRYFPVFGFNFDVINDVFVAESCATEIPIPLGTRPLYELIVKSYFDNWQREYVLPRWGTNVPSWESRSAEAEALLRSWWKEHIYWE